MTPEEHQDLRTQIQAVLRANRELGAGYEQAAVDQLTDLLRPAAGAPRGGAVPPAPAAQQSPANQGCARGTFGNWWWIVAAVCGGFWLLSAAWGGFGAVLPLLIACGLLFRFGRRRFGFGRSPWDFPGRDRRGGW